MKSAITNSLAAAQALLPTRKVKRKMTGQERLMDAIMMTKEAYNQTTKGKRIPKQPTRKERLKIINHMMREHA